MLTIIAFIITLLGSINWLMIGLLQYDFIAGIFGYQASVFSRIIYIIFGVASVFLVFKLFKGKGTLAVFSRRNKRDLMKNMDKLGKDKEEKELIDEKYAIENVESGQEFPSHTRLPDERYGHREFGEFDKNNYSSRPRSMFDEHFDDRGEQ